MLNLSIDETINQPHSFTSSEMILSFRYEIKIINSSVPDSIVNHFFQYSKLDILNPFVNRNIGFQIQIINKVLMVVPKITPINPQ